MFTIHLVHIPSFDLEFYLAFYLTVTELSIWHYTWHVTWHSIWHSIRLIFWHSLSHTVWESFWHSISIWNTFWDSFWHSRTLGPAPRRAGNLVTGFGSGKPQRADRLAMRVGPALRCIVKEAGKQAGCPKESVVWCVVSVCVFSKSRI